MGFTKWVVAKWTGRVEGRNSKESFLTITLLNHVRVIPRSMLIYDIVTTGTASIISSLCEQVDPFVVKFCFGPYIASVLRALIRFLFGLDLSFLNSYHAGVSAS